MTTSASSSNPVFDDAIAHLTNGGLSYAGAMAVLQDAAKSPTNATLFSELSAVAEDLVNGVITATKYVKQMFENVVLGNSANAYWNGGSDIATPLGDLSATSTQAQFEELIGKWFLGADLPGVESAPGVLGVQTGYQSYSLPLFGSAGPEITDVSQGAAGDCWFMAALAETALLDPSVIEGMISQHGNGTYVVKFEVNGQPDYVTVNGELPTYANGAQLNGSTMEFASSTTSLWVPLVEKALAQLSEQSGVTTGLQYPGGQDQYYELDGGLGQGLGLITGQSYATYALGPQHSASMQFLVSLQSSLAAGNDVLLATSNNTVSGNLVANHEFAVTAINASADTVTLYNPWGANAFATHKAETFSISANALVADQATFYIAHGTVTA